MPFELMPQMGALMTGQAIEEILGCNEYTQQYGLSLTGAEAHELIVARNTALNTTGRIEFRGGAVKKIILAFCDSPYLTQGNYCETLMELIDLFYNFKNETMDAVGDDELIEAMKAFDGMCRGSLDLLHRELERLARRIRMGYDPDAEELQEDDDEFD